MDFDSVNHDPEQLRLRVGEGLVGWVARNRRLRPRGDFGGVAEEGVQTRTLVERRSCLSANIAWSARRIAMSIDSGDTQSGATVDIGTVQSGAVMATGDRLVLQERSNLPPIAELAQPMLRLAGRRINPATNANHGGWSLTGFTLETLADGAERRVRVPEGGAYGFASWSPDGRWITFTRTVENGVEQWVADAATGEARRLTDASVNDAAGGCEWMPDSRRLLCLMVPEGRGPAPAEPLVPAGPTIQETRGRKAPVRTYQDLLEDAHDEALFDHYMTAQPAFIDVARASGLVARAISANDAA